MNYVDFVADCQMIKRLLGISSLELAERAGVSPVTLSRIVNGVNKASAPTMESIYDFAYSNNVRRLRLNKAKCQFHKEQNPNVYFHGSKSGIEGQIVPNKSARRSDFGPGFYCGESYEQAASFIASFPKGRVYVLTGEEKGLKVLRFGVDEDWMLSVIACRGRIGRFADHPRIRHLLKEIEEADLIIAPIADNSMYETMNQFSEGELTTIAAVHCLSASSLGFQHVFKSDRACSSLSLIDELYLCKSEKDDFIRQRESESSFAEDKVRMAKEKYRRQGKYIEELLS